MTEPTTPPGSSSPAGRALIPDTASWLQRVAALTLDWAASYGVAFFILRDVAHPAFGALTLAVFLLQSAVGVALTGASFGQKMLRLHVRRIDGHPLSLLRSLERQLLICLVVPPLVFRADGRGLHDVLTDAAVYPHPARRR